MDNKKVEVILVDKDSLSIGSQVFIIQRLEECNKKIKFSRDKWYILFQLIDNQFLRVIIVNRVVLFFFGDLSSSEDYIFFKFGGF